MNFSAEGVAAIIVALSGLIAGLYNLMQSKRIQQQSDFEKLEKKVDEIKDDQHKTERLLEIAMKHIHSLNMTMARNGLDAPELPEELKA